MKNEAMADAALLISEVHNALAAGTKHYRASDNKLLETEEEVLRALVDEGRILFEKEKTLFDQKWTPAICPKTGRPTQPAICFHCHRDCVYAGKNIPLE